MGKPDNLLKLKLLTNRRNQININYHPSRNKKVMNEGMSYKNISIHFIHIDLMANHNSIQLRGDCLLHDYKSIILI